MTKHEVKDWIEKSKIVPVVRAETAEQATQICELLLTAGITTLEITLTVPGAVQVIRALSQEFRGKALIGAGTVLTPRQADECIDAGARFIVAPNTNSNVITTCSQSGILCAAGALTPTEVLHAHNLGADIVKVFPADALGGPTYIKSLRAPLPTIPLMPTGGVTLQNIPDYFAAGAVAVGIGSNLVDIKLLASDPGELARRAEAFHQAANQAPDQA